MTQERLTKEEIAKGEFHCHRVISEVYSYKSEFQNIEVFDTESYGRGLFLDGRIQHVQADEYIYSESMVHPAMLFLNGSCRRVLCIGGGPGGIVRELVKYTGVEKIIQVDIDSTIIDIAKTYFPHISQNSWNDPRVELVIADAFDFLETSNLQFDLIINDLSEPLPGSPAVKFFSVEGIGKIKARLDENRGIYVTWAGSAGSNSITLASKIIHTVERVFPHTYRHITHQQAYGTCWLTAIGSMQELAPFDKSIKEIDACIDASINGALRFYDGQTHYHMFMLPKDVRTLLAKPQISISMEYPFYLNVEANK
jgi:spermidine synthase